MPLPSERLAAMYNMQVQPRMQREALAQQQAQEQAKQAALAQQQKFQNDRLTAQDQRAQTEFDQGQQDRTGDQSQKAMQNVSGFAGKALSLTDPNQRRGFLTRYLPVVRKDLELLGVSPQDIDETLAMDDATLDAELREFAAGGDPQKPSSEPLEEVVGPDGKPVLRPRSQAVGATPYYKPESPTSSFRPLSAAELKGYGLPEGTTAQIDTRTGKVDVINKPNAAAAGRPIPPAVAKGIIENNSGINKIDRALAALAARPQSFGAANYLGDSIRQRTDSDGVDARSKVADIGSLIIHDRSGAAVSASEFPRLAPFIPQATDTPKTVKTKLENLKANIQAMQDETQSLYSPEAGYKAMEMGGAPSAGVRRYNPQTGRIE